MSNMLGLPMLPAGSASITLLLIAIIPLAAFANLCHFVLGLLTFSSRCAADDQLERRRQIEAAYADDDDDRDFFESVLSLDLDTAYASASCLQAMLQTSSPSVLLRSLQDKLAEASPTCAVCLSVMDGEEEVRQLLPCRHLFHTPCIDAWLLRRQRTCPLCRALLLDPEHACSSSYVASHSSLSMASSPPVQF